MNSSSPAFLRPVIQTSVSVTDVRLLPDRPTAIYRNEDHRSRDTPSS